MLILLTDCSQISTSHKSGNMMTGMKVWGLTEEDILDRAMWKTEIENHSGDLMGNERTRQSTTQSMIRCGAGLARQPGSGLVVQMRR